MKKAKEMKTWAVIFKSESSDYYYETFRCVQPPSEKQLKAWWKDSDYDEDWEDDGCQNIYVQKVWEINPEPPVLT